MTSSIPNKDDFIVITVSYIVHNNEVAPYSMIPLQMKKISITYVAQISF